MDLHPQPFYVHELKPVPRDEWPPRAATPTVPVLGTVEVRTKANLRIKPTSCPVVVIATPLDNAPARFAWERPTSEIAQATGGPQVHCPAKPKAR